MSNAVMLNRAPAAIVAPRTSATRKLAPLAAPAPQDTLQLTARPAAPQAVEVAKPTQPATLSGLVTGFLRKALQKA